MTLRNRHAHHVELFKISSSAMELDIDPQTSIAVFPKAFDSQVPPPDHSDQKCFSLVVVDALEKWSTTEFKLHINCKACYESVIRKTIRSAVLYISNFQIVDGHTIVAREKISSILIKTFSDIRENSGGSDLFNSSINNLLLSALIGAPKQIDLIQFLCYQDRQKCHLSSTDERPSGTHADIIGNIIYADLPKRTAGTDFKVTLKVSDQSQSENEFIVINFFNHAHYLPKVRTKGDIVLIRMGKLQEYNQKIQICVDKNTQWMIFSVDRENVFEAYQQSATVNGSPVNDHELFCIKQLQRHYHELTSSAKSDISMIQQEIARPIFLDIKNGLSKSQEPIVISTTKHDYIAVSPVQCILKFPKDVSKFNCRVRVTGIIPRDLALCSRRICSKCHRLTDGLHCVYCIPRIASCWIWAFILICEDATGSLLVYCTHDHAESFLGGLKPVDLHADQKTFKVLASRLQVLSKQPSVFSCSIESIGSPSGRIYSLFDTRLILPE